MAQVRRLGTGPELDVAAVAWMLRAGFVQVVAMVIRLRVLWFLTLAVTVPHLLGCPSPQPFTPPSPDSCAKPEPGVLATLEPGPGTFDESLPFQAWLDDSAVEPIYGGQGGEMLGVRLRSSGPGTLPTCLPQVTRVLSEEGTELAKVATALKTYPAADGSRVTRTLFVAVHLPPRFRVQVQAGGLTVTRTLHLTGAYVPPGDGSGDGGGDATP